MWRNGGYYKIPTYCSILFNVDTFVDHYIQSNFSFHWIRGHNEDLMELQIQGTCNHGQECWHAMTHLLIVFSTLQPQLCWFFLCWGKRHNLAQHWDSGGVVEDWIKISILQFQLSPLKRLRIADVAVRKCHQWHDEIMIFLLALYWNQQNCFSTRNAYISCKRTLCKMCAFIASAQAYAVQTGLR